MSAEPGLDIGQSDVAKVAEIAVEPSFISEIARKLREVDDSFANVEFTTAVRRVAKAVQALERENNDIETIQVGYDEVGGQAEGSAKMSLVGSSGQEETTEWKQYKVVHNKGTGVLDIRREYDELVDDTVSVDDKISDIDTVSGGGNMLAEKIEEITKDHTRVSLSAIGTVMEETRPDFERIIFSDYDSPGIDIIVEMDDKFLAIEVSNRSVNPIDVPYADSKLEKMLEKESELEKEGFLIILAPRFTDSVMDKYSSEGFVSLRFLPFRSIAGETLIPVDGFPVVIPDDTETQEDAIDGRGVIVGEDYPVIEGDKEEFISTLRSIFRNFNIVQELDYRRQYSTQLSNSIDNLL